MNSCSESDYHCLNFTFVMIQIKFSVVVRSSLRFIPYEGPARTISLVPMKLKQFEIFCQLLYVTWHSNHCISFTVKVKHPFAFLVSFEYHHPSSKKTTQETYFCDVCTTYIFCSREEHNKSAEHQVFFDVY